MPASLPQVPGIQIIRVLEKRGYYHARTKGSHAMMRGGSGTGITVPLHNPVAPGTLRSILRAAGMTAEEFIALL
jgi:predicted RNA binding protein YcfA (HicA-like mRNA interferase family)